MKKLSKKMYIYRADYRPMIMGGNVNALARCEIDRPAKVYKLSKGAAVHLIQLAPKYVGCFCVKSGGLCGSGRTEALALAQVKHSLASVTAKQVAESVMEITNRTVDLWNYHTVTWEEFIRTFNK